METAEVKALPSMDARCPRGLLTLHSWIPTMRKNRGALWTTETRAVGAVIYDRPGKCFGFMRTPPSHPHSAFTQRNRFTSHSTLITRSSGLRGIRRVVLPQRGQSTGTPIATLSSSARERQSPLLIEPPTAWCGSMRPTRRNYDQPSPLAGVGSLLRARGVARCSLIYAAIESTTSGRPVPERTAGMAVTYALVRQISPSTSGMPTSEKTRSTREPSRCLGRAGARLAAVPRGRCHPSHVRLRCLQTSIVTSGQLRIAETVVQGLA